MRYLRSIVLLAVLCLTSMLCSCGEEEKAPVRTYNMGDRAELGRLVYVVYETQWMTQLGEGADARLPQHRYFLVRLSAMNGSSKDIVVPNFVIEDDNGKSYPELGGDAAAGVPQYIGYLRRVKPAEAAQGNAVFDAPPRHYKLKVLDEDGEKAAYIDIPLSFTSESPEVPRVGDPRDNQPKPLQKKK